MISSTKPIQYTVYDEKRKKSYITTCVCTFQNPFILLSMKKINQN